MIRHEILLAALGHPGSLIGPPPPPPPPPPSGGAENDWEDDGSAMSTLSPAAAQHHHHHIPAASPFRCTPLAHRLLSPSECESIDRIVACGGQVRFLLCFADRVARRTKAATACVGEVGGGDWHERRRRRRGSPRRRRHGDARRSESESELEFDGGGRVGDDDDDEEFASAPLLSGRSAYVEAAAAAVGGLLDRHERAMCRLERDLKSDPGLGLGHLGMEVGVASGWVPWVTRLVMSLLGIGEDDGSTLRQSSFVAPSNDSSAGVVLLSRIDECLEQTPVGPDVADFMNEAEDVVVISPRAAISHIRSSVCAVYARQIAAWALEGRILDPHEEFFVVSRNRRGRGRGRFDCNDGDFDRFASHWRRRRHPDNDEAAEEDTAMDDHVLRYARLPPTVSPSLGRKVLLLGRAVRILRDEGPCDGSYDDRILGGRPTLASHAFASSIALPSATVEAFAAEDLERTVESLYSHVSVRLHRVLLGEDHLLLPRQLNVLHNVFLSGDGRLLSSFLDRCDAMGLWARRLPPPGHVVMGNNGAKAAANSGSGGGHGYPDFHHGALLPVLRNDPSFVCSSIPPHAHHRDDDDGGRCPPGLGSYEHEISRRLHAVVTPRRFEYDGGRRGPSDAALFRRDYDLRTSGSARVVGRDDSGGGCIVLSSSPSAGDDGEALRWWNGGDDSSPRRRNRNGDQRLDPAIRNDGPFGGKDGGPRGGGNGVSVAEERPVRPGCVYTLRKRILGRGFQTSVIFRFLPLSSPSRRRRPSAGTGISSSECLPEGGVLCVVLARDRPSSAVLSALLATADGANRDTPTKSNERPQGGGVNEAESVVVAVRRLVVGRPEGGTRMKVTIDGEEGGCGRGLVDVPHPDATLTLTVGSSDHGGITANLRVEPSTQLTETSGDHATAARGFGSTSASVESRPSLRLRDRFRGGRDPLPPRRYHRVGGDEMGNDSPFEAHVAVGAAGGAPCVVRRWSFEPGFVGDSAAKRAALEMAAEAAVAARTSSDERDNVATTPHDETETTTLLRRVHDELMAKLSWIDDGGGGGGMQIAFEYALPRPAVLSLVVSRDALRDYKRVFDRVFPMQLCLHGLRECWRVMVMDRGRGKYRSSSSTDPDRSWLAHLWALRARMEFVVGNILRYYEVDVALSALHELSANTKSSENVDHVLAAHARYLATLRRRCFLVGHDDDGGGGGAPSLPAVLGRMTAQVLRFSGLVRRGGVGVMSSSSSRPMMVAKKIPLLREETRRISRNFDDELSNLFVLLQRHDVTELYHRLDFSGWLSSRMAAT